MIRELFLRIVEKLAKHVAGPDCGEGAVDHMFGEDIGDVVAELTSGGMLDGDAFLSWSCCESLKIK